MRVTDSQNEYTGVLDDWKVRYIIKLAVLKGFRGSILDDAVQEVAITLQTFKYDSANSNAALEVTLLTRWIDRKLANLKRGEDRAHKRDERVAKMRRITTEPEPLNLKLDVEKAIADLSEFEQEISELLGRGFKKREILQRLNCSASAFDYAIEKIRMRFEDSGLDEWVRAH